MLVKAMLIKKIIIVGSLLSFSLLNVGCSQNVSNSEIKQSNNVVDELSVALSDNTNDDAEQLYPLAISSLSPQLSKNGIYPVGVKTLTIVNPKQLDPISKTLKDRPLKIELWYPSNKNFTHNKLKTIYKNQTKLGSPFTIQANAYRDVKINHTEDSKYPLIVLSHGYTGYRTLMFYLAEHLASHGFIVASIDHTVSTTAEIDVINAPFACFVSTLLNRSSDQQFTSNYFINKDLFLSKVIDKNNVGLIGYSMGGFGAINTIGGCYSFNEQTTAMFTGIKDPEKIKAVMPILNSCAGGQYANAVVNKNWKAAMVFAPWGSQHGLFDLKKVQAITTPIMYLAGNLDDVSDYQSIKSLYNNTGSNKKYLLTYENARHNIAPHPAPQASYKNAIDLGHYIESAWDTIKLNNINNPTTESVR